jgi:hypothetical protein
MATKPRPKRAKKTIQPTAKATPTVGVNSFLKGLKTPKKGKAKKKDDKPTIVLVGQAKELLELQQAKAAAKVADGTVKRLEGVLFDGIEAQRLAVNAQRKTYVGSIKVTATGNDDNGNPVDPGIAAYYIQNKYRTFDFFAESEDDELQELYEDEGGATLKHEAIHAIMDGFNTVIENEEGELEELDEPLTEGDEGYVSFEDASEMLDERMEVENTLFFGSEVLSMNEDGSPVHPEALALLQNPILAPFLQNVSKAKPTKAFHESSNYDATERAIMDSLNRVGLASRYKAVLKPSGAPKQ